MKQSKDLLLFTIISASIFGAISAFAIIVFFGGGSNLLSGGNGDNSQNTYLESVEDKVTSLVKETSPSVVSVIIKKDMAIYRSDPWGFFRQRVGSVNKQVGGGTGFFISKDGIIITNKHVIEDRSANYTVILNNGSEYDAEVIATNRDTDIAFLQIEDTNKEYIPLKFIRNGNIQIGQFAVAIGNALSEYQNSVSFGVVSGLDREIKDGYVDLEGLIQTDTAINPGNSGGPLLNLDGKVMGINTAIINGSQNIGFAIELNQEIIDKFLDEIKK
ncbi:trypsin-like peptidase domain-containing protein [Candidatus Gracilibacteria bacterium]|nr:trypsin-like peptidase domain-containing protein [Candidatus Gracilibacteria bacterium]